jgi:hypothetical protein
VAEEVLPGQIKQAAERALVIERYILRRAWGLGYAVAAVEIASITILSLLFQILGLSSSYSLGARIVVNFSLSIAGLVVAIWVLKKAYDAMLVRREIAQSPWTRMFRSKWAAIVLIIYYLPVVLSIVFLRPEILIVIFGQLAVSAFPFFIALKVSFPERLPRESIAVLVAIVFCSVGNLILAILKVSVVPYMVALLGALVAVFLLASAYAYRQKPPNVSEDHL